MSLTRRQFLTRVGQAGGYSAAFLAMQGLNLAEAEPIRAETVQAASGSGKGVRVVILGGGIAGLVAAYELRPLGYEVTVLEARTRPGGRNYTVRTGDEVRLMDGSVQRCTWDTGHYQNFGPARLPSIHPNMLGYCKKLGVELQVEVNMSRSAHLQNDSAMDGRPAVMRQVVNDTRGHVSELLMKCMNQGALDAEITGDDRQRMLDFLRIYGPLDEAGRYNGSDRAGYSKPAGAGEDAGVLSEPIDLHTLLQAEFWQGMLFDEQFDMQATMFQPVGGMDRIPYAFAKSLGDIVQFDSAVTGMHKTAHGVAVEYKQAGAAKKIDADYCICAMPLTKVRGVQENLAAPYKKVVDECVYAGAYKIAWESRRFWEQEHNVYGGLEFVNVGCSPIWFPSWGFFSERGVLVSGYTDERQTPFEQLSLEQKFAESRKSIERLHPGFGHELEKPMYYGWAKSEWNEGSWISAYGPGQERHFPAGGGGVYALSGHQSAGQAPGMKPSTQTGQARSATAARTGTNPGYETLVRPDGRILFAGDHCSHIVGWQEGAALSAIRAVRLINDQVKAARLGGAIGSVAG
jgi:monoamine oxidase